MKFSIITPTFNSRATLAVAMTSVLGQAGVELEYLLVDGGSKDGTVELIREFAAADPRIRWISEPDDGIADAFNKGLALARGEWIGILNSDDLYADGALAAVAETIRTHPEAEVIHGDMLRIDLDGRPLFVLEALDVERTIWRQMPINHPTTFVARRAYARVGGFDPALRVAMDYDLVLRLYTAGARFVHLPRVLTQMRSGGASDTRYLAGLLESRRAKLRLGYPRWRADFHLAWRWLNEVIKRGLRRCGLKRLLLLHPRFRRVPPPPDVDHS